MKLIVIAAIVAAPLVALAGPKDKELKAHMAKAAKAHKEGKYELALSELKAAYEIDPKPDLQYAIGQVYVKLGRCSEAREAYDKFVAVHQDANEAVQQALSACKDTTPAPTPEPAPAPAPTPEEKPAPAPAPAPAAEPPHHEDTPFTNAPRDAPTSRPWYTDKLGDALVASGVIVGVIGVVEYRSAVSSLDDAESAPSLARYKSLVDDAHTKRTYSVVLIGGGAALLGAGVLHYMFHERGTESRAVGVAPAHGGGVVTWGGQF